VEWESQIRHTLRPYSLPRMVLQRRESARTQMIVAESPVPLKLKGPRRITSGGRLIRSATFLAMKGAPMADLEGTFGIAWDVGFVGYFSNGVILDGDGLINGREIARMQKRDRLQNFVSSHSIKFVFANDGQLGGFLNLSNWTKRGSVDLPNFGGAVDRHYLLVRTQ
jgi:hypothetical protein